MWTFAGLTFAAPVFCTAGVMLLLGFASGSAKAHARAAAAVVAGCCMLRYLYWRVLFGVPVSDNIIARVWIWGFFAFEMAAGIGAFLMFFFLSRTLDRSAVADARRNSPLHQAPVDVFIATYNEGREVLERTLLGALALEHADLRVWVLDDGARPWVAELALEHGAMYTSRIQGKNAKAGNVNEGLLRALASGRRPEFVLLLDADFVPNRKLLRRTLGLFEEQDVGIVQTPQHFFNPDPIQRNLFCTAVWPDDQRFFFNVLMPSRDAWGTAFCCGTSAVFRVEALVANRGMATETVTEDLLTSYQLVAHGYRTIYLNEPMSLGLAPESLGEYLSQRSRWCLGNLQQVFTRWSFAGRAKVGWRNRLGFFDSVLYWLTGAPFRLLILMAPIVYWWTGVSVIQASTADLLYWLAPAVVSNLLFLRICSANRIMPVISDVTQLLSAFVILRTAFRTMLRPFGHPFKVTAKGFTSQTTTVHWDLLTRFLVMLVLLILGMLRGLSQFSYQRSTAGFALAIVWSLVAVAVLSLAALASIEAPQRRTDHRFRAAESATFVSSDGTRWPCNVFDLSVGGARMHLQPGQAELMKGEPSQLWLDDGQLRIRCQVMAASPGEVRVRFQADVAAYQRLVVKLFSGSYDSSIAKIEVWRVFRTLARAIVR